MKPAEDPFTHASAFSRSLAPRSQRAAIGEAAPAFRPIEVAATESAAATSQPVVDSAGTHRRRARGGAA